MERVFEMKSTYDTNSLYEPITRRPSSQLSNGSTYSTASGLSSLYSQRYYPQQHNSIGSRSSLSANPLSKTSIDKEDEVDHLTDLLVKSMENSSDPDFFGMCHKCGEKVLGEGSGCTAMEKVYHIQCFTCHICHIELRGKPFYAMDGKPYCEDDYLNTLEKCCVCEKPILDRILRATGKAYHPNCFTCVVCSKCLDGIPFTVDATNKIHCIDDFHKKFAPRCCVCKEPIVPEPGKTETVRVVALDRSFHVNCYKCEDCDLLLSSEAEGRGCYPLDDHILCRNCNAKRVQEITAP
ncbi:lipoma-preferred partner homolog isoform X2 [Oppia nitens]|uniref:lipoma-preferred partner homolog isoform X2 n=1 Tax=Oppia nitens TaxID=1686743 RepID=UPI0023DBD425|nr:lipoma-preferred partner homolog isoform X2 [Oppia nitens]